MRERDIPARERILAKLEPQPNGCWHWTGVVDRDGYGHVGYAGRRGETLHRAVYMEFVGPIPDGFEVDHVCHNEDPACIRLGRECAHRRCGNPAHLRAVSPADNSRAGKGKLTECPHGHPYDEANTYTHGGRRFCRQCNRVAGAAYRSRRS